MHLVYYVSNKLLNRLTYKRKLLTKYDFQRKSPRYLKHQRRNQTRRKNRSLRQYHFLRLNWKLNRFCQLCNVFTLLVLVVHFSLCEVSSNLRYEHVWKGCATRVLLNSCHMVFAQKGRFFIVLWQYLNETSWLTAFDQWLFCCNFAIDTKR